MTEAEAKRKWCPFQRVATLGGSAVGNMGTNEKGKEPLFVPLGECIGSECMAWRWSEATPTKVGPKMVDFSDPKNYRVYDQALPAPERRRGFCGLVGKP